MHKLSHYSVSMIDPSTEDIRDLTSLLSEVQDLMNAYIESLSSELGISIECAADVWYLRTRFRHTQELEDNLIRLHREGTPPNMNEYGHKTSAKISSRIELKESS